MGAAPGADRRHRPRLRPARDADAAPAGEADDDRADVPLRPPAGRAATASSGSSTSRPSATRAPRSTPRSSSSATGSITEVGVDRRGGPGQLDRRRRLPARLHRGAHGLLPGSRRRAAADRARPPRAQRPAPARLQGPGDGRAQRGGAADHRPPVRRVRGALRGREGAPDRASACRGASSPGLVRGLDYYTRTAFEYYVAGREGQQQAIGGGGRYDGLVELLGGRPTPGIGFGLGLDRVALVLAEQGAAAHRGARRRSPWSSGRTRTTRSRGCGSRRTCARRGSASARTSRGRKLGRQLEAASRDGAHFAVILGDELAARPGPAPRPARRHATGGRARGPGARAGDERRPATSTAEVRADYASPATVRRAAGPRSGCPPGP